MGPPYLKDSRDTSESAYYLSADRAKRSLTLDFTKPAGRDLAWTSADWIRELERIGVPCGPINNLEPVFADPQVRARGMTVELPHPAAGGQPTRLIANPIKFSQTPISYDRAPPTLGEHTDEILRELLGLSAEEIARLRNGDVI